MSGFEPLVTDDLRHELDGDQFARESLVFDVHVAGEFTLSVYTWINGVGKAGYAASVFGPVAGAKAIFEATDGVDMPADADFTDWRLGTLALAVHEPLQTASVSLSGERLGVELAFTGMHPAFAYHRSRENRVDGCPEFLATGRFEQSGRVTGSIRIDDRTIEFDDLGHRDHSWGHRNWEMMQRYQWIEAQAVDIAVNALVIEAQGRKWSLGYVYRDGEVAAIHEAVFDVEYDDRWVQDDLALTVVDSLGRTTRLDARRYARHEYPVGSNTKLVDTGVSVEIEGRSGAGYVDFAWPRDYLRTMREFA